jgi:hypothetical protein
MPQLTSELSIMTQEDILVLALQDLSELQCMYMIIVSDISRLIPSRNFDIDVIYSGTFQITVAGRVLQPNVLFVLEIRRSIATKVFVIAIAVTDCE